MNNPFDTLESDTVDQLVIAIRKNFSITTKGDGTIIQNNSKHFELYKNLLNYCITNKVLLQQTYNFTGNMNYGGWVHWLLMDKQSGFRYLKEKKRK